MDLILISKEVNLVRPVNSVADGSPHKRNDSYDLHLDSIRQQNFKVQISKTKYKSIFEEQSSVNTLPTNQ
jgi:hypothetical protein